MPSYKFTTPYVFWTQVNNHEEINERVLSEIAERRGQEGKGWTLCDAITSVNNKPEFNDFLQDPFYVQNILWDPIDQMIVECDHLWGNDHKDPIEYRVSNCWYNIYNKGAYQEIHDHTGMPYKDKHTPTMWMPLYSVAYVVKAEGANDTVFTINQSIPGIPGGTRKNFHTGRFPEIGVGTVMIFPSYLEHFVLPCKTDGRVTLTYNIVAKYPAVD